MQDSYEMTAPSTISLHLPFHAHTRTQWQPSRHAEREKIHIVSDIYMTERQVFL